MDSSTPLDLELLERCFGHRSFRGAQQPVIRQLLAGIHTLAILPTGAGKSLCYQYTAMAMPGLTIVISPLIALMKDQVDSMVARGIPAAKIDSSEKSHGQMDDLWEKIAAGGIKILYLSPEQLGKLSLRKFLSQLEISLVAIDEAHCMSLWGNQFRPAYLHTPKWVRQLKPRAVLALTATATPKVASDIRKSFGMLKKNQIQTSFFRENLHFLVTPVQLEEKDQRLLDRLNSANALPAIVYAHRRSDTETIAAMLASHGFDARAYHAGMSPDSRARVQDGFASGKISIICATIAFGMGVDIANIRSVIHYHLPSSPASWVQESGRAGRDGQPSTCELLACGNDKTFIENHLAVKQPTPRLIRDVLERIFSQSKIAIVSRYDLSTLTDLSREAVELILTHLQLMNYLAADRQSWKWAKLRLINSADGILASHTPRHQKILNLLINDHQRINLTQITESENLPIGELCDLLYELDLAGDAQVQFSHRLSHFLIKKPPENLADLASQLGEIFQSHVDDDEAQFARVLKIASGKSCLPNQLVMAFGEKRTAPCGHCSSCLQEKRPRKLPFSQPAEISLDELEVIQQLANKPHAALASAERLAKFLCGIYTPSISRYRLAMRKEWSMLKRHSYADVLIYCREFTR
ncbi:RecQ family ATP-dependent DNA helicase [Persicirhabdus sediminis]|uniref:DNA 3'-5' helicase n=1 Tax=Persicirhabdus sediminis TaxID=454144 RepID=A0A8J7SN25_9BACT|nr:RecQ family ATP-dependent DNA helicase [Persicirhabdus sediminis]MBK1791448.1 ATP-dependent DNA helicase RecQ [Persicirhabdus sediminis]